MKIGVIGGGVVGSAVARSYLEFVDEVRVYDVVKGRATHGFSETLTCDLVFVCLPTPLKNSTLDVSYLDQFCNELIRFGRGPATVNLVLRSTVPIGTTRRLRETYNLPNLVHSPEFLTARCAATDAMMPARNIIGSNHNIEYCVRCEGCGWYEGGKTLQTMCEKCNGTGTVGANQCHQVLQQLYKSRFPGVPIYHLTSDESEAVKLIQNSYFACKVSFFNEARTLTDKLGLDWERILEAVIADGRIGHTHTKVPGPDGKYGFGGACLPKDLACFVRQLADNGLTPSVGVAAMCRNEVVDRSRT